MRYIKLIVSLLLFVGIAISGYKLINISKENQQYKKDYAELNHFKYGLFSVDEWKNQLSVIISEEIDNLSMTRENERSFKKLLEVQLGVLIDKIIERLRKSNNKDIQGWIKQGLFESFVDINDIKRGIPVYADAIMKEMTKKRSEKEIKALLKDKIDKYIESTFDTQDNQARHNVLLRTKTRTLDEAHAKVNKTIRDNSEAIGRLALYMIVLSGLLFLIEAFNKKAIEQSQYIIMAMTLAALLIAGVTTPMIDMEAKISKLSFVLLGHQINFENQVLYFQSKSINDVFWIMITHHELQMKLVGILMVAFSIVFPVFKMLSSLAYYYDFCQARKYKLVQFFVLKSGKWSMADVLVVAMFMAYIGFNGIINSQLGDLSEAGAGLDILTTNGTNLQPGYYLFLAYTILAMFLSGFLKSRPYECRRENTGLQ